MRDSPKTTNKSLPIYLLSGFAQLGHSSYRLGITWLLGRVSQWFGPSRSVVVRHVLAVDPGLGKSGIAVHCRGMYWQPGRGQPSLVLENYAKLWQ